MKKSDIKKLTKVAESQLDALKETVKKLGWRGTHMLTLDLADAWLNEEVQLQADAMCRWLGMTPEAIEAALRRGACVDRDDKTGEHRLIEPGS